MKILLIGHYYEASGVGTATRNLILAMDSVGLDIVLRPFRLNNSVSSIPQRIRELEQKDSHDCDVCIQYVLPHYYVSHGDMKNIGVFVSETSCIKFTSWPEHINLMDEVWVPCQSMLAEAKNNGIKIPVKVVPHTFDALIYQKSYPKMELQSNDFIFYFIGEFSRRKHLTALIKAFHIAFHPSDPVSLLLKVNKPGVSEKQLVDETIGLCNKVKEGLRLYRDINSYKDELIIASRMTDEGIYQLHNSCDCFVMPSYGEAWCIPAFDAMAFGKMPICSNCGGMRDYIVDGHTGALVDGTFEPVIGYDPTFPDFGTGRELWFNIDICDLVDTLRKAFEMDSKTKELMKVNGIKRAEKYSYKSVGEMIKRTLC